MDLYDIHQNHRIANSEQKSQEVARDLENTQDQILELKGAIQKLSRFCNGMWELIEESTDLSAQDLRMKLQQLEEKATAECSECGRPKVSRKAANCLYCGAASHQEKSLDDLLQI